jgi:hypothetical protein
VTSCPQPRNRPGRVHLCKLRHPPPTTLALPLAGRKAIALAVLGMRAPILAPIVAMASNPRALRTRLVLAVVGIALPLGPLPTSPARALTGRCTAVLLIRDLRTWSERPAAARTPPPLHGRSLRPGKPERSSVQRMPTNEMARMPPPPQPSPPFDWRPLRALHKSDRSTQTAGGSILVSAPRVIPKSVEGLEAESRAASAARSPRL